MAKVRGESKLRSLAILGAQVRIKELQAEIAALRKQFGGRVLGMTPDSGQTGGGTKATRRRRRKMSAEARKRISEAQKARWRKQKAGKS